MALKLYDTLTPDGDYPLMQAKDVEMPDGTRLSEFEGGGGGSVSWEDVTDKPFYEIENEKEILAETTSTSAYTGLFGGYALLLPANSYELVLGNIYKVLWDGEEFTCEAKDGSEILWEAVYVGNATPFGLWGNNEPFAIIHCERDEYDGIIVCLTDTEETAHTVAIYQDTTAIKPLDPKFLPVATAVDLTAFESDGIIVETYADGSTVTTTMERNAEGKITKITDSNGNVTVLTR